MLIVLGSLGYGCWLRGQFRKDVVALRAREWNGSRLIQAKGGLRRETVRLIGQCGNLLLGVSGATQRPQPRTAYGLVFTFILIAVAGCFGGNTMLDARQRIHLR